MLKILYPAPRGFWDPKSETCVTLGGFDPRGGPESSWGSSPLRMKVRATRDFLHATRVFLQRLRAAPCDPKHAQNASAMDRTRWRRSRDVTSHSPKLRALEPRSLPTSSSGARSLTPPSGLLCHKRFATKSTLIEALSSKAARRNSKCCSICTGTTEPSHHHVLKPHAVLAGTTF